MVRTVLVAGIEKPENSIVKFCHDNWLTTYHMTEADIGRTVPICDALILVTTTATRQELAEKVGGVYEGLGRPILHNNGNSISVIRHELEDLIYGPGQLKILKNRDIPWWRKFSFLCGKFYSAGDTIVYSEFRERFQKATGLDSASNFSTFLNNYKAQGAFEMIKRGSWRFHGLTDRMHQEIMQVGLVLQLQRAEEPAPSAHHPELVLASEMPPTSSRSPHVATHDRAGTVDILLDTVQRLRDENSDLRVMMGEFLRHQEEAEERITRRIRKDMESTINIHLRLFSIEPRLRSLDGEQLQQLQTMISLAEGWRRPPSVLTQSVPPALS